jgi:transcription termination/antitermination protein NusG
MAKKWYVIHAQSGFEQEVKESIKSKVKSNDLEHMLGRVMAPVENVSVIKGGKKRVVKRAVYPGYVLVEMELSDEMQRIVKRTPKVTGFVGAGKNPVPVEGKDLESLLETVEGKKASLKPKLDFKRGDAIRIVEGPFENFQGTVDDVYSDKGKIKAMISIFGRLTPVELELWQVEKL